MYKKIFLIILIFTLNACATSRGFDRGSLSRGLGADILINDAEIERVLALKPQITTPFKLGIFFNPQKSSSWYIKAHWSGEDKELFESVGKRLIEEGVISAYVPIISSTVPGPDLRTIRLAAARYNVDAVLIINGVSDIDTYNNNWGSTYILLVTTAFVPGTVTDAIFLSNATLWDVKNEYLYIAAEAEGVATEEHPALMRRESQVAKEAKKLAIKDLAEQVYKNISNLK